ncbi:MAG: sugar ABC transporter permease [Trueperaceae bacterium]|nr:sugar ABC transporter permease [Trueperaceae bacterium]
MATTAPRTHYRKPGFWRRLRTGNPSEAQLGFLLLVPTAAVLILVMLWPILQVLWQSLHFERLNLPARGRPFIGVEHYGRMLWGTEMTWDLRHLLGWRLAGLAAIVGLVVAANRGWMRRSSAIWWTLALALVAGVLLGFHPGEGGRWNDGRFWNSFSITLLLVVASVVGSFLVGLPLALLANVESRWRWLVRIALLIPWAMPRVLVGIMFAWLFNSTSGVINDLLARVGIEGPLWLARSDPAIVATTITIIWATSAFVGLILLAGLQSIDGSLYEAAKVDGANGVQRFFAITLPLLQPAIAVALIFRTLTAIQTFDIPYAMTRGGPGRSLETLGIYITSTTNSLNLGYAAALSVALFVMSLVITVVYLRWIYTDA